MRFSPRIAVAAALVATATLAACSGSGSGSSSGSDAEELPPEWEFDLAEELPELDYPDLAVSVNGFERDRLIITDAGILALFNKERSGIPYAGDGALMLDADSGELKWVVEEPNTICATPIDPAYVVCTYADGAQWSAMRIDAESGQVEESWPIDVTSSWGVAHAGDGLIILDETSERNHMGLTLVDSTGAMVWQLDTEKLLERAPSTERDVNGEEHTYLFDTQIFSTDTFTLTKVSDLSVLTSGTSERPRLITCRQVITHDSGFLCDRSFNLTGFDAAGTIEWSRDEAHLINAPGGQTSPLGKSDPYGPNEETVLIDPLTGEDITTLNIPDGKHHYAYAFDEYALINNYEVALLIDTTTGNILWESDDEELVGSYRAFAVGDVLIDPGFPTGGFDLATGERLWEYRTELDLFGDGGNLYGAAYASIIKYDLPN